jgi:hypothetical protein
MSRLEDFINQNRDAFDDEMPSEELWQKVEAVIPSRPKEILKKKQANVFSIPLIKWSIAASVLLIAVVAIFFIARKSGDPSMARVSITTDTTSDYIASVVPEASPEVSQFAKLIALKQEELKEISKEQPELYQKFTTDINQLDSSYRALKTQLSIAPNKEMLIEAMVQNLQLQLNVLNQQLNIINQIKHSKKYSHEKNKNFT